MAAGWKPSETSGGFFLQKSFLFFWKREKEFYLSDMNNTQTHNTMSESRKRMIQSHQEFLAKLESKSEKSQADLINIEITKDVLSELHHIA